MFEMKNGSTPRNQEKGKTKGKMKKKKKKILQINEEIYIHNNNKTVIQYQ